MYLRNVSSNVSCKRGSTTISNVFVDNFHRVNLPDDINKASTKPTNLQSIGCISIKTVYPQELVGLLF